MWKKIDLTTDHDGLGGCKNERDDAANYDGTGGVWKKIDLTTGHNGAGGCKNERDDAANYDGTGGMWKKIDLTTDHDGAGGCEGKQMLETKFSYPTHPVPRHAQQAVCALMCRVDQNCI